MTVPKIGAIVLGIGAVVGLALLTRACGPTPDPSGPYREQLARMAHQHSLDSAEAANAYEAKRREADSLSKVAASAFQSAARYHNEANRLRAERQAIYVPSDSTPCDSALVKADSEANILRESVDTLTHAIGTLTNAYRGSVEAASAAYTGWMRAEGQLSQERSTWEDERQAWRATVKRLKPCSLLGLIGCPVLSVGYGVQLSQGRLTLGPTVSVGFPIRF